MRRRPMQIEIGEITFEGFDPANGPEASQALERELAPMIGETDRRADSLARSIARAVRQRLSP